jgi:hypothetical protein
VRERASADVTQSLLRANLAALVGFPLRAAGRRWAGIAPPIVPRIHANDNVRAPDLAVTCLPPSADKRFPDPVLIIEVLSPSNQKETWESIQALRLDPRA